MYSDNVTHPGNPLNPLVPWRQTRGRMVQIVFFESAEVGVLDALN
jgi:hypothetical protein